jgi:hypothetical protein
VFFNHHTGAQNDPAPTLQTEITQVEARVDVLEGEALTQHYVFGFCHTRKTGFRGGRRNSNDLTCYSGVNRG